ncbi:Cof-type HAD-IIB family hydrolase [Mycoplasma sp. 128]|uniref:Cof-type HAD-IIB family hydrolase n=1 Tax=Mycoplasma sp. 3341 TaxID=3447506 RepID=UPI003F657330
MNFQPKAIFLDLDGTLVDKKSTISQENIETIKEINKSVPCFISTGRAFNENLLQITNTLGLDYGIAQNGAIIFDKTGTIIRKITINDEKFNQIIKILIEDKFSFIVNSSSTIYSNNLFAKMIPVFKKKIYVATYNKMPKQDDVTKILVLSFSTKKLALLQKKLLKYVPNINVAMTANNKALEINDIEASKGFADSYVCALKNIDPQKAVHLGDSMNDASAKQYLGALIAMKNSSPQLKNLATEIGAHYKKAGVSKILKKLINAK